MNEKFLTPSEIQEFLTQVRQEEKRACEEAEINYINLKRGEDEEYSQLGWKTVRDLCILRDGRDVWDAVSTHFRIPFETLLTLPATDGDLLLEKLWGVLSPRELSDLFSMNFEAEQLVAELHKKIEKAGGVVPYFTEQAASKRKQKQCTQKSKSSLLPRKYR